MGTFLVLLYPDGHHQFTGQLRHQVDLEAVEAGLRSAWYRTPCNPLTLPSGPAR